MTDYFNEDNRAHVALGYIVTRTQYRIAEGQRAGEAAMNSIAKLDPILYEQLLKAGMNFYQSNELGLEDLWQYILEYYQTNDKAWKEPK